MGDAGEVTTTPLVLAVDGNSLVHRSYHAQARMADPSSPLRPAWAVRGLLGQLVAAVERVQPTAIVVGFDDPDTSLRRERWPSYKANRTEKLDTLVEQLATAVTVLRELGVAVVVPDGLEADDVLCSTAATTRAAGGRTVVVTSDRDAFALIDDRTDVLRIINGGVEASPTMTCERLVLLLGVRPDQYRDFAALRGDPSDNLPGVRGIGPRTAARLLAEFGTAAAAFADPAAVAARLGKGVAARLGAEGAREAWQLNCRVMTMYDDVTIVPRVLPLDAATVEAAFRGQGLTWSVADAVRVLAGVEPDPAVRRPVYASAPADPWPVRTGTPRRLPPLRRPAPAVEQLSLF